MNCLLTRRRSFVSAVSFALAGVSSGSAFSQGKPEKAKVGIAVASKASLENLPLTMADRLGYFAAEGLEVDIHELGGGVRALQSVVKGSDDVIAGAFEQTIHLQSKSQFFRAFVLLGRAPQIAVAICTKTLPLYKSVADLKGRKIGIAMAGSMAHTVARSVLTRAGVAPQDVSFVELSSVGAAVSAVKSGQIHAISSTEPLTNMLERGGNVRIIADTRSLIGAHELFGGPMPAACLYAPIDFVQKNPKTVQSLTNAVVHALKWLQTASPTDLIKEVPEAYQLGDRSLYLAAFSKVREAIALDGLITDEGVKTALRLVGRLDPSINLEKIDLARTFTNEFSRKSKDKFRA